MRILAVVSSLLLGVSFAYAADTWNGPPVLVTTGSAVIRAAPDRAIVRLGTEVHAKTAKDAQQQEAQAMTAVRKQLTDAHVPDEAIRTLSYDLQQEFDFVQGKQIPRDFVARHVLEVRLDDVAQLGDVMGRAAESGAATISGIQFDVKARDELERTALRKAVEDARARADAAAAGAGTMVAGVIRVEEERQSEGPRPMAFAREMPAQAAVVATPVAAGEIEIRANVTLTSSLK